MEKCPTHPHQRTGGTDPIELETERIPLPHNLIIPWEKGTSTLSLDPLSAGIPLGKDYAQGNMRLPNNLARRMPTQEKLTVGITMLIVGVHTKGPIALLGFTRR